MISFAATTAAADLNGASRSKWILLGIPLALAGFVNYPIVENYFFVDDFLNLYQIENFGFARYLLTPYVDHVQPTRNAVFYLCAELFGVHPAPYYGLVLLTHLLNVWLLFRVIELLTRSPKLGSFGAAAWSISPHHAGTLGWYSVFGHVLVGTALLVIINQAVAAAVAHRAPTRGELWLWYVLALLAATSFGSGVGLAMMLPFALQFLLPAGSSTRRMPPLISLVVVVPVLYALLLLTSSDPSGSQALFHTGDIGMSKLARVLLYLAYLIASGFMTLVLGACGGHVATRGLAFALLAALAIALIAAARSATGQLPHRAVACSLLLLACYGTIALGRFGFVPENLPLEALWILASMLGRYQYVGQLLLAILLCLALRGFFEMFSARAATVLFGMWLAFGILSQLRCVPPPDTHLGARQQTEKVIGAMRAAIAAQPRGADVYIDNREFAHVLMKPTLFPGWAAVFTIFFPENTVDDRRVYFVEPDDATRAAAARGRRTAALLVPVRPH